MKIEDTWTFILYLLRGKTLTEIRYYGLFFIFQFKSEICFREHLKQMIRARAITIT